MSSRSPSGTPAGDGDFWSYYERLNDLIAEESWAAGEQLAELFSCQHKHAQSRDFQVEDIEEDFGERDVFSSVFDDMVAIHCRVLFYLARKQAEDAFATQMALLQYYNKEILTKEKDMNWFCPILDTLCTDLRIIASMADSTREVIDEEAKSYLEEATSPIMERNAINITKKVAIMSLTNQLFRIYFRINRLPLLKPLIRAIEQSGPLRDHFALSDEITYKYFVGRKAIFDNDLPLANEALSFAFDRCPEEFAKNKRLILIYLIPVKMFLGFMPNHAVLQQYELDCFEELVMAVKEGNVGRLERALTDQQDFFIDAGIFLMVEKLKMTTFLNLIKLMHKISDSAQIKIESIVAILSRTGVEMQERRSELPVGQLDPPGELFPCIVLIPFVRSLQKKMKGYISYNHQTLVLSKLAPFPQPT
ncbi:CSN12-like protein [Aphelenchoides fujianensis]|nr:CSN12-like protein [Aphelenchoides fujianensis]